MAEFSVKKKEVVDAAQCTHIYSKGGGVWTGDLIFSEGVKDTEKGIKGPNRQGKRNRQRISWVCFLFLFLFF